jgi:hypothetical protein
MCFSRSECKEQVYGIFNAKYKKFGTMAEAEAFVTSCMTPTSSPTKTTPQSSPEKGNRAQSVLSQPLELQKRLLAVGSQADASPDAKRPKHQFLTQQSSSSAKSLFPAAASSGLHEQLNELKLKIQAIENDVRTFAEKKGAELEIVKAEVCRLEELIAQVGAGFESWTCKNALFLLK